ncbi:hypothetical protein F3Y22_tig00116968pilonHSYRG00072 [Hibiscus syriacus]|uniref:RNase H type-1 domain-containing protein n=1 Tax=Hibiscus syriacus TaxID=106335 RepID=A0A6A2XK53_HIBSY|nr:hypothetical protein F3Y22_tig00116968pilonHSYRG00072 [Hibiscus syriacus]
MAAGTFPHPFVLHPEMAEALAYEYAIRLSKELGFHKIVLEGDCFEVIAKLQRPLLDRSSISTILLNIESMKDDFEELTFLHVPRICNTLAHLLAVISKSFPNPMV